MAKTLTHGEVVLRPLPGTRFSVQGMDVVIQYERGKEQALADHLRGWIDQYIVPEMNRDNEANAARIQALRERDPAALAKLLGTTDETDEKKQIA